MSHTFIVFAPPSFSSFRFLVHIHLCVNFRRVRYFGWPFVLLVYLFTNSPQRRIRSSSHFRRVPASESDIAVPVATNDDADDDDEGQQSATSWDPNDVVPFPPHPIMPYHDIASLLTIDYDSDSNSSATANLPKGYVSSEGWSASSRSGHRTNDGGAVTALSSMTVIGYYAAWQWYDNAERAAPTNMEFSKVDRVNYAFFQADVSGAVWGTDSWADPIVLL